jgi:hypothetical protein
MASSEKQKAWRLANKDHIRQYNQMYRQKHPEKVAKDRK